MKEQDFEFKDTSKIYLTSDSHFHHLNIIKSCGRPFKDEIEMNEILIENWNKTVPTDGIVFHLGDFAWGGYQKWKSVRDCLNGHIILIKGNHDDMNLTTTATKELFDYVSYQMKVKFNNRMVYLNHFPFLTYAGIYREPQDQIWALHGHVHFGKTSLGGRDIPLMPLLLPTQYDVGVDMNNYRPISWEEVESKISYQVKNNVNCCYWIPNFDSNKIIFNENKK